MPATADLNCNSDRCCAKILGTEKETVAAASASTIKSANDWGVTASGAVQHRDRYLGRMLMQSNQLFVILNGLNPIDGDL